MSMAKVDRGRSEGRLLPEAVTVRFRVAVAGRFPLWPGAVVSGEGVSGVGGAVGVARRGDVTMAQTLRPGVRPPPRGPPFCQLFHFTLA